MDRPDEFDDLKARAAELESRVNALSAQDALIRTWGLSAGQARALAALADGDIHSIDEIAALCARGGHGVPQTARVEIHRLRQKIEPVKIKSIYGRGYRLDEPHLSTVLAAMGGQK